jgi:hypothetical protein
MMMNVKTDKEKVKIIKTSVEPLAITATTTDLGIVLNGKFVLYLG